MLSSTISATFFVIFWISTEARPISVPITFPDSQRPGSNYNRRQQNAQSDYQRPQPVRGEARPNSSNANGKLFFNSFQRPQQYYPDDSQQYYPQRPSRPQRPQAEVTTESQSSEEIPDYDEVLSDDNNGQSGSTTNSDNRLSINSKFGGFHDQRHHHRKKYKKKHRQPCVPFQGNGYYRQNSNNNNGNGKTFFDFKRYTIPVPFPYPYPYPIYDTYGGYPCHPFESHPQRPHRPHRPHRPNRPSFGSSDNNNNNNGVFQDEVDGGDDGDTTGSDGNGGNGGNGDNGGSNASNVFFGQGGLFDFSEGAGGNQVIKPVIDTFADTVQNVSQNWMPGQVVGGILNSVGGFIQQIRPAAAVAMAGDALSDAGRNFNNLLIRPFYDLFR